MICHKFLPPSAASKLHSRWLAGGNEAALTKKWTKKKKKEVLSNLILDPNNGGNGSVNGNCEDVKELQKRR